MSSHLPIYRRRTHWRSPTLLKEARPGPRSRRWRYGRDEDVWHDAFKAEALTLARPVQVVRPATYGDGVHRYTRDGRAVREIQDEATRAWNFYSALYYKAGGIPWRLVRESTDLSTCFVGVSFYDDQTSETLCTSVAQVFNERGEGMVVRGGPAELDEHDRTPHLSADDARVLLTRAVEAYRREHRTPPAPLVCHKSSYFTAEELQGCSDAAAELRLDSRDLLSLRRSGTPLYRTGSYPPLRGTAIVHEDGCLLYTQGSVDFYRCYPGLYTPRTLDVRLDYVERGGLALMAELLALTKMNWNSSELVNLEPITLAAARGVGCILRHVPRNRTIQSRFSFFM